MTGIDPFAFAATWAGFALIALAGIRWAAVGGPTRAQLAGFIGGVVLAVIGTGAQVLA